MEIKKGTNKNEEKKLQTKLVTFLKNHKEPYYKTQGGMIYSKQGFPIRLQSGWPDLLIVSTMKVYFIELKTDIGLIRPSQKKIFADLNDRLHNVYILRPKYWDKFKKDYKDYGLDYAVVNIPELYKKKE